MFRSILLEWITKCICVRVSSSVIATVMSDDVSFIARLDVVIFGTTPLDFNEAVHPVMTSIDA